MTDQKSNDSQPSDAAERPAGERQPTHTWHFVYKTWKRGTQASDEESRPEAIMGVPAKPAMEVNKPVTAPPPPQASPIESESVTANLVTSGTKGGAIAANLPRSDRRFGIGAMAAALLVGIGLIGAIEYFGNARLRASVETALNASQTTNAALGQLRSDLAAMRLSLDQSGRLGEVTQVHDIREALAGLQRRLGEIETSHAGGLERLAQRLDADESRQTETSQKLAGLADGLSELARRTTTAIAERSTSSAQKQTDRLPATEGWRVVDMSGQRAIVRNPSGRLYEVSTGSEVPGLGMIENIRRAGKRVTVVTQRGVITAVLESNP